MNTFTAMSADEAGELRRQVEALEFIDGVASARGSAREVKHNQQARPKHEATQALVDDVIDLLSKHRLFVNTAFPRQFVRVAFNRYGPGDGYGMHVDAATIGPIGSSYRTDLSFTLFLSEPDEYEGGELHIADGGASPRLKLPAGQLVLYPTRLVHQVTPVVSGVRYAAIGWIESWIADPTLREIAARARTIESMLHDEQVSAVTKLMMGELGQDIVRYGAR